MISKGPHSSVISGYGILSPQGQQTLGQEGGVRAEYMKEDMSGWQEFPRASFCAGCWY